jgi:hypothetical protein
MVERKYQISEVTLMPTVIVRKEELKEKAERVLQEAEAV